MKDKTRPGRGGQWARGRPDGPSSEGSPSEAWLHRRQHFQRRFFGCFITLILLSGVLAAGAAVVGFLAARRAELGLGEGAVLAFACLAVPIIGFLLLLSIVIYGNVATSMAEMMATADRVAAGDFSARVRVSGDGDLSRFATRFNRMTEELGRAEEARRNLTADVAHELRTPLQIIQGNLEGVLDGVYEPTAEHVRATLDETRRLGRLVGDLQTLSQAESGQLPLYRRVVAAADLLDDVVTRFLPQAMDAGITLKATADASPINVDPDRLAAVLSNLVANALRHTPSGGRVSLIASAMPDGIALTVSDTGEGIAADDLPHIFDRFWRGDRARGRTAGAGLGLAIARQLVLAHGGTIDVRSAPGEGTTFAIFLPE